MYLDHRIEVVTRRSRFRLARRKERLHLVEGLLIAILDIDEVIQVIRASDDGEQARTRLMDVFDLSELQAEYILELRLRRLTKFSRIELEAERDKLKAEIAELEELLASEVLLRNQVARELDAAAETYGTPRRTLLLNGGPVAPRSRAAASAPELQIADAPCRVFLSATGRMVRAELSADAPNGGVGPAVASLEARCRPLRRRHDDPRRRRRGDLGRTPDPLLPGRSALGARATRCSSPRARAPTSTSASDPASTWWRSFPSRTHRRWRWALPRASSSGSRQPRSAPSTTSRSSR